uniref:Uncharacterized protein n=1 Tax=viral metagenome TaxID=1070528 RepID=A0A6C0C7Z3_9ZZZZ
MRTRDHIKMVAGIYRMIINGGYLVQTIDESSKTEIIDKMGGINVSFEDLCKLLERYSLPELRKILYSFALIIKTNDTSIMESLKLSIQFIERDMILFINDNRRALYGVAKY